MPSYSAQPLATGNLSSGQVKTNLIEEYQLAIQMPQFIDENPSTVHRYLCKFSHIILRGLYPEPLYDEREYGNWTEMKSHTFIFKLGSTLQPMSALTVFSLLIIFS
jgi:hypothetical protein